MRFASLFVLVLSPLAACGDDDDDDDSGQVPILTPEPAGAPDEVANGLDPEGRTTLGCLGRNTPDPPDGSSLTLPGWIRTLADPTNEGEAQPAAGAQAYDEDGTLVGAAFSDTGSGRVAVTVPIRPTGFVGTVSIHADGYVDQRFVSSRPITGTAAAGWTWLVTAEELTSLATDAGVILEEGTGTLVGAVHDCDIFGVANAVLRIEGSTNGVVYFDGFALAADRTFTAESGRFAVPNLPPGVVTVEAFGRTREGGPLELLSLADVPITADRISAVDLEPRVGTLR